MKILALISILTLHVQANIKLGSKFEFGLATAPGHAEDNLNDIWLDFAENEKSVSAYMNQINPGKRLKFWTDYKSEIDLAAKTGIQVYRLGVDWGRLTSSSISKDCVGQFNCIQQLDINSLNKYREIIEYIRSKNIKVMLTLFHHSLPMWAKDHGGFTNSYISDLFIDFAKQIYDSLGPKVDYWITINEPSVYSTLTHVIGLWPSKFYDSSHILSLINIGIYKGRAVKVLENMARTHNQIYKYIHSINNKSKVSIAKNVANYTYDNILYYPLSKIAHYYMNYSFLDKVITKLDFIGINYYGAEYVNGLGVKIKNEIEYSEAGRAIDPNGLYTILKQIDKRYNTKKKLPFFITENGIADATDILRPSYLIEHLHAINKAKQEGLNILGYIFWTLSDNWEWADGYCPKFGLASVDRSDIKRKPRPSYYLYKKIATNKIITNKQRSTAWDLVQNNISNYRPFCRSNDGVTSLSEPRNRPISKFDWRFSL